MQAQRSIDDLEGTILEVASNLSSLNSNISHTGSHLTVGSFKEIKVEEDPDITKRKKFDPTRIETRRTYKAAVSMMENTY